MDLPALTQFRIEPALDGVVHLVFDCPGRTMNVFSDAAIRELGAFASWLADADVQGVVIRSGKGNAFCAGADLTELVSAYDMIMAAPPNRRFDLAYAHFFRLSAALRALETAGKPVAAAIAGLALGGGCELAMAAHHRVLVDDPKVAMGLPESLVGLLPGAGGTQRLPRLIGVEGALPILLDGARLSGEDARTAGLADVLVARGDEVAAAEAWVRSAPNATQPWDRADWRPPSPVEAYALIKIAREKVLSETLGHYPAPIAILDCIQFGLPQGFDGAIRSEMSVFSMLIQREEPRNMIRSLFIARTEYERIRRAGGSLEKFGPALAALRRAIAQEDRSVLARLGFGGEALPIRQRSDPGLWVDQEDAVSARDALARITLAVTTISDDLSSEERPLLDYLAIAKENFPGYLGGPFAFRQARLG